MAQYLCLTQLYPSGLSGTSVKTKQTFEVLLAAGHSLDVVCIHHKSLLRPTIYWPERMRIFVIERDVFSLFNFKYILEHFGLFFSSVPFRVKKMFAPELATTVEVLLASQTYDAILIDGYAMLQYVPRIQQHLKLRKNKSQPPVLYIDDEDIAELMRQRFVRTRTILLRLFFWLEWQKCLRYERFHLSLIDQLWAISKDTLARLKKLTTARSFVMPTVVKSFPKVFSDKGQNIVFAGLLSWLENVNGLIWFIDLVWPQVHKAHPKTKFVIMGQMAKPDLIKKIKKTPGLVYRGFVPDLKTEFQKAALAVAPILINCGIKIKVVTYLSYGLPVVTTPQSTVGLGSLDGVTTGADPKSFAAAVNALLGNVKQRQQQSRAALKMIEQHHSPQVLERFFKTVHLPGF
jgi:glycosyltransferase involved in cell wall biosynthesis